MARCRYCWGSMQGRLRTRRRAAAILLFAVAGVACGGDGGRAKGVVAPTAAVRSAAPTSRSSPTTRPCQRPPLEARAATGLAVGINDATTAEAPLAASGAALGVGGVILLGPNILDAAQARAL